MTSPETLQDLAERVMKAEAEDQRAMLTEAWVAINGPIFIAISPAHVKATDAWNRFRVMLDVGAYESAAMKLVPEGCTFSVDEGPAEWIVRGKSKPAGRARVIMLREEWEDDGLSACQEEFATAATPALALVAASLLALAKGEG